jgi:ADP-ribose pyrophosphatase
VKPRKSGYQRAGRRLVASNQRFHLYFDDLRLPGGQRVPEFLIVRPKVLQARMVSGVCVLPLVEGRVGLMRSYRHQLERSVWQAVAGFVEPGESLRATAAREIAEETALTCRPRDLISLGRFFPEPGLIEGALALFLAPCTPRPGGVAAAEIGTGRLTFFTAHALGRLLARSPDVGGSTLVAGYRYLARRAGRGGKALA